jgi:beta-mannosidase
MKQIVLSKGWYLGQQEPCERLPQEILGKATTPDSDWLSIDAMPSMVHDVLQHHGEIEEPWKAGEAEECKWVAEKDWVYATQFDVADPDGKAFLHFLGLDTIVDIYLNGELAASRSNMYLPLRLEVSGRLLPHNRLVLHFHSVFQNGEPLKKTENGLVRRPGNNYGSYLGPQPYFSRVGVFDSIFVESVEPGAIYDFVAGASLDESFNHGVVKVHVTGTISGKAVVVFSLLDPNGEAIAVERIPIEQAGDFAAETSLTVSQPSLWWPRGYGDQALYRIEARLVSDDQVHHEVHRAVGFRRIEMTEPLHFKVNGKNVRLWGGDWVTPRWDTAVWDSDRVRRLLDIAENAHFNTFRIWGPVESPRDEFYEMCDRRGFLLWQDFTDLPLGPDPAAREVCREEARYLIERLRSHPSIFFWCGCNEAAMWNDAEYFGPGGRWPARCLLRKTWRQSAVNWILTGRSSPAAPIMELTITILRYGTLTAIRICGSCRVMTS